MRTLLAAALVLLFLSDAHAGARDEGDFCGVLKQYVDAAPRAFKGLRGRKDDLGDYTVKTLLPGAAECVVFADDSAFLSCEMGDFTDASRAKIRFSELVRQVRGCLSEKEWPVEDAAEGDQATMIFRRKDDVIVEVADDINGAEHSLAISVEAE